jgi:hypothetical protein
MFDKIEHFIQTKAGALEAYWGNLEGLKKTSMNPLYGQL